MTVFYWNNIILVIILLNCVCVIIGTIIGAGFSSGKEIFTFFNIYGFYGLVGLILSQIIIGIIIYKFFVILIKYDISSYSNFIHRIIPKSNFMYNVVCNIVTIFLLISFIVMVAGFSAYFNQEYSIPYIVGSIVICVLSFFTFLNNINGIVRINSYFIPFLIFIIILLGFKNLECFTNITYHSINSEFSWVINFLLYASYNLVVVVPILITLKKYVTNIKKAKLISFFVTLFLIIMSVIIFILLNHYFIDIHSLELPIIYIASQTGNIFRYVYGIAILFAIFTTAISSGYAFLNNLNIRNKKAYTFISFLVCLVSIFLSNIGFGSLLNNLYPILGFLGFIQMFSIITFTK